MSTDSWVIKKNIEKTFNNGLNQMAEQVGIYESPLEEGNILGYAFSKDQSDFNYTFKKLSQTVL